MVALCGLPAVGAQQQEQQQQQQQQQQLEQQCTVSNLEVAQTLGEPAALWSHFASLSSIPRPSRHEEAVLAYVRSVAERHGLVWNQDAAGNLLVRRPGSGGGERADPVLMQGHVDMVCEQNVGVAHDFNSDALKLRLDGDWLRATDTTLGADNGIGVASILALLESGPDAKLPPLEALFTVNEETGLIGASTLDGGMVSAKRMLNLDTEEFGSVYIGCSGGSSSTLDIQSVLEPVAPGLVRLELEVRGLLGGHSGINIHEYRGNAVVMASILATDVLAKFADARLLALAGGDKHNAIPREARAVIALPEGAASDAKAIAARRAEALRAEYGQLETGLEVVAAVGGLVEGEVFSKADASRVLAALRLLPHGVIKMSHAIEGLVETSNNVASVQTTGGKTHIVLSSRSSLSSALEATHEQLQAVANLAGGTLELGPSYPGWAPVPSAPLVNLTVSKVGAKAGFKPQILAVHAGLECGILLGKCPCIEEAVSFGPTIKGAHSPDERLEVSTVAPFYSALLDILAELAATPAKTSKL